MTRSLLYSAALALVGLFMGAWYWNGLPDPMPVHFGPDGTPDGFMPRTLGVLILPGMVLLTPLLLLLVTRLDPRRAHVDKNRGPLTTIVVALAAFTIGIQWMVLSTATSSEPVLDGSSVLVLMGLLWVVLGNVLPKLKSNWFAGIRTPWTLHSERVWHRTHRVAGWCFAITGLLAVGIAAVTSEETGLMTALPLLIGAAIVPVVYSYIAYLDEGGRGEDEPEAA